MRRKKKNWWWGKRAFKRYLCKRWRKVSTFVSAKGEGNSYQEQKEGKGHHKEKTKRNKGKKGIKGSLRIRRDPVNP